MDLDVIYGTVGWYVAELKWIHKFINAYFLDWIISFSLSLSPGDAVGGGLVQNLASFICVSVCYIFRLIEEIEDGTGQDGASWENGERENLSV